MKRTLEDAQLTLGHVAACLEQHDAILGKVTEKRSEFEMAMLRPSDKFDPVEVAEGFKNLVTVARQYGERITEHTAYDTMAELRRAFNKAKNLLGILGEFQERVDRTSFFLEIYEESGHPPDLDKGEEFDLAKEKAKLTKIKAQYEYALEKFIEFAFTLDIGDPSKITPASRLVTPSQART